MLTQQGERFQTKGGKGGEPAQEAGEKKNPLLNRKKTMPVRKAAQQTGQKAARQVHRKSGHRETAPGGMTQYKFRQAEPESRPRRSACGGEQNGYEIHGLSRMQSARSGMSGHGFRSFAIERGNSRQHNAYFCSFSQFAVHGDFAIMIGDDAVGCG